MSGPRTAIVGAGRMGQGIGLALAAAGWDVTMLARTAKPVPPPLRLFTAGGALDGGTVPSMRCSSEGGSASPGVASGRSLTS